MDTITTTDLRTKSPQLLKALESGKVVTLIHRSRIVGKISPAGIILPPVMTPERIKELKQALHEAKPKKLVPRGKRDKMYRKNLEEKYGKAVS